MYFKLHAYQRAPFIQRSYHFNYHYLHLVGYCTYFHTFENISTKTLSKIQEILYYYIYILKYIINFFLIFICFSILTAQATWEVILRISHFRCANPVYPAIRRFFQHYNAQSVLHLLSTSYAVPRGYSIVLPKF